VQAAIREAGAYAIALILRGCLVEGDVIAEAGLSAQSGQTITSTGAGLCVSWVTMGHALGERR